MAAESLLVLATEVVQAPNDKQQIEPMLGKIGALPNQLGKPETLLADSGYFSAAKVTACPPGVAPRRETSPRPEGDTGPRSGHNVPLCTGDDHLARV